MDLTLYYIYHSGFAIETKNSIIIIDYYEDSTINDGIVHNKLLKTDKKIYVLATHIHHDHYNPEILNWYKINRNITYILSQDIKSSIQKNSNNIIFLDKGDFWTDQYLKIEAYGSTDAGISFAIKIDGKSIFHAGDLNNWHWKDEATAAYSKEAEDFYLSELKYIKQKSPVFDLVMFPVDQRLQTDYYLGAKQFVEEIKVHYFAPMHFDLHYTEANAFSKIAKDAGVNFIKIDERGQKFNIKL